MAIPIKQDHCPRDTGCTAQTVWIDPDNGDLFSARIDTHKGRGNVNFVPHVCTSKADNVPPTIYVGKWKNKRTGFTRYVGPHRMQKSALKPPPDASIKNEWFLINLLETKCEWLPIEIPTEFKDSIQMWEGSNEA
jgi:hypothetical protein